MTKKELLQMLEREARDYRNDVLDSVIRNSRMSNLTEADTREIRRTPTIFRRFAEAVLVDFVNTVGTSQGLDYGLHAKYFRENKPAG